MSLRNAGLALLAALLAGCGRPAPPPPPPGPPAAVIERLARGINLSIWFTHRGEPGIDPQLWFPDAADFALLRKMGLRHVRVQVDPAWLADPQTRPARLAELRDGVQKAGFADLMTVIALQPASADKQRLAVDPAALESLVQSWRGIAAALATVAPRDVVFETLNEPELKDPVQVRRIVEALAGAIRAAAPQHTLAVSGGGFADVEDLLALQPLADPNVLYSFHFYEPKNFTHQGATWGWPLWAQFHDWPYPSSPEAVAPLLADAPPEVQEHLRWHGEQRWDRAKLAAELAQAALWGKRHHRVVWCSEFGVARAHVQPADRRAWLRDVRDLLAHDGIPWTHWDYVGHFGLADGLQGARVVEPETLASLGLKVP